MNFKNIIKKFLREKEMKDIIGNNEKINLGSVYNMQNLSFGIGQSTDVGWYYCRDTFLNNSENISHFYFYNKSCDFNSLIKFIFLFESIAGVPLENRSQFELTRTESVCKVLIPEFWRYKVRRSLLTALLRCGVNYKVETGSGFESALWSTTYTSTTKKVVEEFLSGKILFKLKSQNFGGWSAYFQNNQNTKNLMFKSKKIKASENENKN